MAPIPDELILHRIPAGVVVIDPVGTVLACNQQAASLVGRAVEDLIGHSVLEVVDPETSWAYAAAAAMAADYPDVDMGPLQVTFRHADSTLRRADLWARNHLSDPGVGGIVCLLTPETAAVGLGASITAAAKREPFEEVARKVSVALAGHPVSAGVVVLAELEGGDLAVSASTADDRLVGAVLPASEPDDEQPWHTAVRTGTRVLVDDVASLGEPLAAAARDSGYTALWCEPIARRGGDGLDAVGVLVVCRDHGGNPSPNELSTMFQAGAILSIAAADHDPPAPPA